MATSSTGFGHERAWVCGELSEGWFETPKPCSERLAGEGRFPLQPNFAANPPYFFGARRLTVSWVRLKRLQNLQFNGAAPGGGLRLFWLGSIARRPECRGSSGLVGAIFCKKSPHGAVHVLLLTAQS